MPLKPNSIIPGLIEQVFEKYEQIFIEQRKKGTYTKDSIAPLLIELDAIFGDVLKLALHILDTKLIKIYTTSKELRHIVEVTESGGSQRVTKLLPDINYCNCNFFSSRVLQIAPLFPASTPTAAILSTKTESKELSYTCEHVLALRLIKLLPANCLHTETLPAHQFNFLLKTLNPSAINVSIHSSRNTTSNSIS